MISREDTEGRKQTDRGRRRWSARRILVVCWLLALGIHVAWVPNLVWFMAVPPEPGTASAVIVETVGVAPRPSAPQSPGRASVGHRPEEIRLPGVAPGGSTAALAANRSEWEQQARVQRQSWAPRALDRALVVLAYRPRAVGAPRSPWEIVAHPSPGDDDIRLSGDERRDDSLLRRQGERLRGEQRGDPGGGGTPSAGNRVPLDDGSLAMASAGLGAVGLPGAERRGARPRVASPRVTEAPESADAFERGPVAGLQPSRQASPSIAWTTTPVREARRSSGGAEEAEASASGQIRRRRGQGDSRESRGPGHGGRGRGTRGAGSSTSSLLDEYLRDCTSRIGRHWSFPRELAFELQQGLVLLEVQISHDGRVERVTVQRSSGHEAFDATAVQAVELANPLAPPPPEELFRSGRNYVVLHFPMRYRNPMFE